jgi:hypothetical protein
MNKLRLLVLSAVLFMYSGILSAQSDTSVIKFSERKPTELEFEVTIKETVPIGYAYCFVGTVLLVNRGPLKDERVLFTVVAGDTARYNTMKSGNENTVFTVYCMKYRDNEEYRTTYVTGFVDSKKTSWKIVDIRDKSKENKLYED